jgi:hypothetical protein
MSNEQPSQHGTIGTPDASHEKTDVSPSGILIFGGSLVVGAILVHLLIWVLFVFFGDLRVGGPREYPMAPVGVARLPPAPRLQDKPREDLKALRRDEDRILTTYGWADQNNGVARIPIDEAMKRVLQQGLPSR